MLHLNTINDATYHLLQSLCSKPYIEQFALAGGTALALQLGHRRSIDIDLFSFEDVDMEEVSLQLLNDYKSIIIRRTTKVFIFGAINEVKTDLVKHHYAVLIEEPVTIDGIRMYSIPDIAAMKLNAVCGRGTKKDFYDVHLLLQQFTLSELLAFYEAKFQSDNGWMVLKSLQYFDDADSNEQPDLILQFPHWEKVKAEITNTVNQFKF